MVKTLFEKEALHFHSMGRPGKLEITPTKPLSTPKELALAYTPGVAVPCLEIERDPSLAYEYTAKGNIVAVISNGTAVLGLGDIGALASKPVMEGKAVLFKRFADIDGIDLEIETKDVEEFINAVRYLGPSFGGINLEDIKAPECFVIEERLKELMDIPVFHDDQHGTAIAVSAGLINALDITKKEASKVKVVFSGAGAAAIACAKLMLKMGVKVGNIIMLDRSGVIYKGRTKSMNAWKEQFASDTKARDLKEAMRGADVFVGLSGPKAVSQEMVLSMAPNPIIFAMANPEPEILPELVKACRKDAIIATGRSDYPNQVNNALCFPYIFRGALDARASNINDEMKLAAAYGIALLAREDVHEDANKVYEGKALKYGPDYIMPVPFDPRLIHVIPPLVAQAAAVTGVARKPIQDLEAYKKMLMSKFDPTVSYLEIITERLKGKPQRVVFAEGEEEVAIRAAVQFHNQGLGDAILVGQEKIVQQTMKELGIKQPKGVTIHNAKLNKNNAAYIEFMYKRLQRSGYLFRDCQRMVHQDRHVFSACMLAFKDADAMVTGLTRNYSTAFEEVQWVIDVRPERKAFGMSILMMKGRSILVADTAIHEKPDAQTLVDIAIQSAAQGRIFGHTPRVAFVSHSNFGNSDKQELCQMREAIRILDTMKVDFEYEGDMTVDVALNMEARKAYPFCRLKGPANVLIMPDLNASTIASQLLMIEGSGTLVGPILMGLDRAVQIVSMSSGVNDTSRAAFIAAYQATQLKG